MKLDEIIDLLHFAHLMLESIKICQTLSGLKTTESSTEYSTETSGNRDSLKLVMNPHGQIQDLNSMRKQGYTIESALSPDVCLEIVKDLNSPKGKGTTKLFFNLHL